MEWQIAILLWQNDQESRLLLLVLQMKKVKENQMLQVQVAMKKFGVKNCTYNFNPQWLEEFSWLVFEEGAMFCKFCDSTGEGMAGKSQFVTGKRNFKRNNHETPRLTTLCHVPRCTYYEKPAKQAWNSHCCFQQSRVPKQRRGSVTDEN